MRILKKLASIVLTASIMITCIMPIGARASAVDNAVKTDYVGSEYNTNLAGFNLKSSTATSALLDFRSWLKGTMMQVRNEELVFDRVAISVNDDVVAYSTDASRFQVVGLTPETTYSISVQVYVDSVISGTSELYAYAILAFTTPSGTNSYQPLDLEVYSRFDFTTLCSSDVIKDESTMLEPVETSKPEATPAPTSDLDNTDWITKPSSTEKPDNEDWFENATTVPTATPTTKPIMKPVAGSLQKIVTLHNSKIMRIGYLATGNPDHAEYKVYVGNTCKKSGQFRGDVSDSIKLKLYSKYKVKLRLCYYNGDGEKAYTSWKVAYGIVCPVINQKATKKTIRSNSVTAKWNKVLGATSYDVYVGRKRSKLKKYKTVKSNSCKITGYSLKNRWLTVAVVSKYKVNGKSVDSTLINYTSLMHSVR